MSSVRTRLLIIMLLLAWLSACNGGPTVTSGGTPVESPALANATLAVHAIEVANIALGDWLIARHQAACAHLPATEQRLDAACVQATAALHTNATKYAPQVLKALLAARDILKALATTPSASTEPLAQALAALQTAFAPASQAAQMLGWQPPTPPGKGPQ